MNKSSSLVRATKGCSALGCGEITPPDTLPHRADGLPGEALARSGGWGLMLFGTREKYVSRFTAWRYVRPFVCNNHYSVCDRNRIGDFACDDNLPQHLASASQAGHPMKELFQRKEISFAKCRERGLPAMFDGVCNETVLIVVDIALVPRSRFTRESHPAHPKPLGPRGALRFPGAGAGWRASFKRRRQKRKCTFRRREPLRKWW